MDRTLFRKCGDAIVRAAKFVAKPFRRARPMEEKPSKVVRVWANGFRMDVEGDKLVFTTSSPCGRDIRVEVPNKK